MARRRIIPYNPKLVRLARQLRKSGNLAEALLWSQIKNRQVRGCKFLRQSPMDEYIVDFFCPDLMLVIEIDGETHDCKMAEDRQRQARLETFGIRFLRFLDSDVRQNMDGVLMALRSWIDEYERQHPPVPPRGGNHHQHPRSHSQ
ncbi:MAG: endonuclease domain-containing protein [Syntrophobacteraceae bacterium]